MNKKEMNKFKKAFKESLTDEKFWLSKNIQKHFTVLSRTAIRKHKDRYNAVHSRSLSKDVLVSLTIAHKPTGPVAYATSVRASALKDKSVIFLNPGHQMFEKSSDRAHTLNLVQGLLAHELSHILNSDFRLLKKTSDALLTKSELFPLPVFDTIGEKNYEEIQKFISASNANKGSFLGVVQHINNIIEDGHIENMFLNNNDGILTAGLNALRDYDYENTPTLEDLEEKASPDDASFFRCISQALLTKSKYGDFKYTSDDLSGSIYEALKPILSEIEDAVFTNSAVSRAEKVNSIVVYLWPFMENYLTDSSDDEEDDTSASDYADQTESDLSDSSVGSSTHDLSKSNSSGMQNDKESTGTESSSGEDIDDDSDNSSASDSNSDKEEPGEEESAKGESSDDSGEESGDKPGDSTESNQDDSASDDESQSEESDSNSDSNSTESDGEANSLEDKIMDVSSAETGRMDKSKSAASESNGSGESITSEVGDDGYLSAAKDIERILDKMATESATVSMNTIHRNELNRELNSLPRNDIHKNTNYTVNRIVDVDDRLIDSYDKISAPILKMSRILQRKVSQKLIDKRRGGRESNLYIGRRLDSRTLIRNDGRHFYKNRLPGAKQELSVTVLIDESGSMHSNDRITYARTAAILLEDFCSGLDIPFSIVGHTETYNGEMSINMYSDFESADSKDKYRLLNIAARSGNRDGAALEYCYHRLSQRPEEKKLLLVISDGQPSGCSYFGSEAIDDMKSIIQKYEKRNIQTIAAAIGDDKEEISDIYGSDSFLDVSNLDTLATTLANKIIKTLNL